MESSSSGTAPLRKLSPRKTKEARGEALMNVLGMLPDRSLWLRYSDVSAGSVAREGSVPLNLGPGFLLRATENNCSFCNDPSSAGIEPEKRLSVSTVNKDKVQYLYVSFEF
jgi:hypothetical protein